jgi:hypothetical protein
MRSKMTLLRKIIVNLLVLASLVAGWLLWVILWAGSIKPGGSTLAEHLAQRPKPERSRAAIVNGKQYLFLDGPWEMFPCFPSGPPAYVFDRDGNLVDWTPIRGDSPNFDLRWPEYFGNAREVSAEELAEWSKAHP